MMKEYLDLVDYVLKNGQLKKNRTDTDTLSCFAYFYRINLQEGYPLLTTKKIFFNSMLHELLWYLSGEEHIKELRKHTKIWDAWADDKGQLETAYGRFWRRYPVPEKGLPGENWGTKWISRDKASGGLVFDQIQYIIDTLKEIKINPETSNLRRMIVSAWHPGNAAESKLPPCHYTFCFNVTGNKLNCHLTQRSADIALGVPFNIACYSLLTFLLAKETGFEAGEFAHTLIDAHIYVDHIEGLKTQLERKPGKRPDLIIADKPMLEMTFDDIKIENYNPQPVIKFPVAV
ncbi:MAG: thymidylate synthase [Spirochaetales bacterium]|nr:thymidylate synthase [Spirochaetales bacterium]